MNYRPVKKTRSLSSYHFGFLGLIILVMAIYFLGSSTLGWLYTPVEFISRPVVWTLAGGGRLLNNTVIFFQTKNSLIQKNNDLKQENLRLRNLYLAKQVVETENAELKSLLNLRDKKRSPLVLAVSVRPNQTTNDILLLDSSHLSKGNN